MIYSTKNKALTPMLAGLAMLMFIVLAFPTSKVSANYSYGYQPTSAIYYQTPNYYYVPTTYSAPAMSQEQMINHLRLLIIQLQNQISYTSSYQYTASTYGYKQPAYVVSEPRSKSSSKKYHDDRYYYDYEPTAETNSATSIERYEARLRGYVDMNDARNGEVFFVYGTDRSLIDNVHRDFDSYSQVDTRGERLRKVRVDSSLNGSRSYESRVSNLSRDTRYYFRICVGHDGDRSRDTLTCGDTRNFTTNY